MIPKIITILFILIALNLKANSQELKYTNFVDPSNWIRWRWQCIVGPCYPFGMIKPGPDCNLYSNSGYEADFKYPVLGFSQTHVSGTGGGSKYGNISVICSWKCQIDR
jgi:putative alpha-1,2-mannosidase